MGPSSHSMNQVKVGPGLLTTQLCIVRYTNNPYRQPLNCLFLVNHPIHSLLEQQYCFQRMHFWRTIPACNTYLGEHLDKFSAKSTGRLWINLCFTFYNGNIPKYVWLWPICISFCQFRWVFFAQKKYNIAKVANILIDSHCKKKNKDITITAQWILQKLGQNVLVSIGLQKWFFWRQ